MGKIISSVLLLLFATGASAQSLSGKVSGAVGGVGATSGLAAGNGSTSGGSNPYSALNDPVAGPSGQLPGSYGVKVGDKVIQLRGAVGVGDDRSNFRADAGIPF